MSDQHTAARRASRLVSVVCLTVAAVAAAVHLIGQASGHAVLADATEGWLVPPLALFLAAAVAGSGPLRGRRWTVGWMAAALLGCWLGDLTDQFLPKLAAFLAGHVCFCVAWWPWRRVSVLWQRRRRPAALVAAATVAVGMVALLAPRVGAMIVPVGGYAVCICAMALLATCLGRAGTLGGLLFVASDAMLAVEWFVHPLPMSGLMIMGSYIAAQWLLVLATAGRLERGYGAGSPPDHYGRRLAGRSAPHPPMFRATAGGAAGHGDD